MKFITVNGRYSDGRNAVVDDEDFDKVIGHSWSLTNSGYVAAKINGKTTLLHRLIMDCPANMTVNHKNHDPLVNTKDNLEICTHRKNTLMRQRIGKGYYLEKRSGNWYVNFGNKNHGTYSTEEEAKSVYEKLRKEAIGRT